MIAGSNPAVMLSEQPRRSCPVIGSARKRSSSATCLSSSNIVTARCRRACPYSVGTSPFVVRSRRRTPSVCSVSPMAFETAGCEIPSAAAAFAIVPASTAANRMCRFRSRMRCPMRSCHCIGCITVELCRDEIIEFSAIGQRRYPATTYPGVAGAVMNPTRRDLVGISVAVLALGGFGQLAPSLVGLKVRAASAAPRTELSAYDAVGLAELIRSKKITAAEAVEDVIRKIEALNPKLNAVIHNTYDRARQPLKDGVSAGPFAGVPILVKDNATIAGVRLTRGSRAFRDNVPEKTAPFFEAIERAGFVLVGVTNMPELGIIDGTENFLYGATRNPWNLEYSPGGSSGGSAACVAAGVLPLAHGTDGGGSIRIPASHCALFGLKASRGRLLPGGFGAPPWPRLVEAGLSRTVRDTAMYLSVPEDPNTPLPKLGFVAGKAPRRLKIALNFVGDGGQMPDPQVRAAIADTASLCSELGHA